MPLYMPAGITFAWPSTVGTIPSGWSRVTAMDDRMPVGALAGLGGGSTGGVDTHLHTSASHTHTIAGHTHTGTTSGTPIDGTTLVQPGGGAAASNNTHTHTASTSGSVSGGASASTATWASATNLPAFVRVIWVEANTTREGIPDGAWAWWDDDPIPASWSSPAAAQDAYLKGAVASGDGGATGGAANHSHTAAAHGHSLASHTHTGAASGTSATPVVDASAGTPVSEAHAHTVTFDDAPTGSAASSTSAATGTTSHDPPFLKLAVVENATGSDDWPSGIIGAWRSSIASIPTGWALCDGTGSTLDMRGRFPKGANPLSTIGDTGGATGHDHTDPAGHTHTQSHTHTENFAENTPGGGGLGSGAETLIRAHTHTATSGADATATGSTAQTVDSVADSRPLFFTVLFLKFLGNVTVTVTNPSPSEVLLTDTPQVAWTLSAGTQESLRVRVYTDAGGTALLYDSGTVVDAANAHTIPGSAGLQVNTSYWVQVDVETTLGLVGQSSLVAFTVQFTSPGQIVMLPIRQIS